MNKDIKELDEKQILRAVEQYQKKLKYIADYQKQHKDKCSEKAKKYMEKIKNEEPEKYEEMLKSKREYYYNVAKPRKLLNKEMQKKLMDDFKIEISKSET